MNVNGVWRRENCCTRNVFVNNALTIKGLANVDPNSSLLVIFLPMTSLFTQPDITYTTTDLTSR